MHRSWQAIVIRSVGGPLIPVPWNPWECNLSSWQNSANGSKYTCIDELEKCLMEHPYIVIEVNSFHMYIFVYLFIFVMGVSGTWFRKCLIPIPILLPGSIRSQMWLLHREQKHSCFGYRNITFCYSYFVSISSIFLSMHSEPRVIPFGYNIAAEIVIVLICVYPK